ncbi:Oidioi.mRNA.OKI2018_I69.PAR.g12863.t1.cds [Oikopleura dioica]|uniref:Oidioi.mRNA.OKI2018_I69.PAR.g12863.t1.cds n=1 Tax=Oikopleura dioica TaxID=34765 RepID=A0ABN7S8X8_OIKDI|nr:Oidioi.mRNA.OKI2018_I69.PAR.g12863.t1.cds [Oikopleura dioica]
MELVGLDKFLTYRGEHGNCDECGISESTTVIQEFKLCKPCKDLDFPDEKATFQYCNSTFKCRAGNCAADKLSYLELVIGTCCEAALMLKPEPDDADNEHEYFNDLYQRIRKEDDDCDARIGFATSSLSDAKKNLKKAKEAVAIAKKELESEKLKGKTLRKLREKSAKRVLFVTQVALETVESEPKSKKPKTENEKPHCKVCFFPFDNDHPEAVIIPCGHKACFNCISNLPQKKCPSCHVKFTKNRVFKVFN